MWQILRNTDIAVKRLIIILIAMFIIMSVASPFFLTKDNMISITMTLPILGVICAGEFLVIIMGHFDLSVGAVAALTGVVIGYMDDRFGIPILIATLIGLLVACLIGILNGFLVTKVKINSFITTLGVMTICRGFSLWMTRGQSNQLNYPGFLWIGRGQLFDFIPIPFLIMIVIYVILFIFLKYTNKGRDFYAVGGNKTACKMFGINVTGVEKLGFLVSGLTAGISGVIIASGLGASLPGAAVMMEMTAISGVVLGGAALGGGKGTLIGTVLGVILMRLINNSLVLLDVSSYYQNVVNGSVLLVAVALDCLNKNKEI